MDDMDEGFLKLTNHKDHPYQQSLQSIFLL